MEFAFSWSWFFIGILITAASAALVVWHQPIADNLGSGVSSYDRFKLAGVIGLTIGLAVMLNLHTLILTWLLGSIFGF